MSRRVRMSPVDSAWLLMDREPQARAIKALLVLDRPLDRAQLEQVLHERLIGRFTRFRQRAVYRDGHWWWQDDPAFALSRHLTRRRRVGPPSQALNTVLDRLGQSALPTDRPLWALDWLPCWGSGSALILRVHHCMADGVTLMRILSSLTDAHAPDPCADIQPKAHDAATPEPAQSKRTARSASNTQAARGPIPDRIEDVLHLLQDPQATQRLGALGGTLAAELAKMALTPPDEPTRLKGPGSGVKQVAWSAPLPHPQARMLARALGCSVDELFLACAAGALRQHLLNLGDPLPASGIRIVVPVSLRSDAPRSPASEPRTAAAEGPVSANRFGLISVMLPLHEPNPLIRVQWVRQQLQQAKRSLLPPLSLALVGAFALAPPAVQDAARQMARRKATAVLTHVHGPRHARSLAGARIQEMVFWVPQSGDLGLGLSILSYAGELRLGLIADRQQVDDPRALVQLWVQAFESLMTAVLLNPGPWPPDPLAFERALVRECDVLWPRVSARRQEGPKAGGRNRPQARRRTGRSPDA